MKVPPDVRKALTALMAEYAMAIDDNRLEDWVELFDEACDNKHMLRDRVESYRHVNLLPYDRHVLGPLHFTGHDGALWKLDVSYSLFQTELEGASRLFSVGRYRVDALVEGSAARLKSVTVVADTGLVPSLLATPI